MRAGRSHRYAAWPGEINLHKQAGYGEGVRPFSLVELELEGREEPTIFLLKICQLNYGLIREGFF
jgi:hypothetical protein